MLTRRTRTIEGCCWVVAGALICVLAWKAHLGSFREPGPGFVTFATGLFILIVGLIMVLSQALSKISRGERRELGLVFRNISWSRLVYTMTLLFAYALLLDFLGYVLTTFLVMWGLFYGREKNRLRLSFLISLVTVGASYLVFEVWLRCQLPRGILPWW